MLFVILSLSSIAISLEIGIRRKANKQNGNEESIIRVLAKPLLRAVYNLACIVYPIR